MRVAIVGLPGPGRTRLVQTLEADHDIAVAGEAVFAGDVVAMVARVRPDVVIVDVSGDPGSAAGKAFVEQIMAQTPTPILTMVEPSPSGALRASEMIMAGALQVIPRPEPGTAADGAELRRRVRALRGVTVLRHPRGRLGRAPAAPVGKRSFLVAIAASTGGPSALATVLGGVAAVRAPVLVIQHIHPDFVDGLVAWMSRVAPLPVRLATDGAPLECGIIYIGPGDVHLKVAPGPRVLLDPEPASMHRPSADELFRSVAEHAGIGGVGVVLTGMGNDGSAGLLAIRRSGGLTIAQDEATSAVFGMPHAAQVAGAVTQVLPLEEIAAAVVAASQGRRP